MSCERTTIYVNLSNFCLFINKQVKTLKSLTKKKNRSQSHFNGYDATYAFDFLMLVGKIQSCILLHELYSYIHICWNKGN